ncbi:MAG TPA: methyltransferase domain-containing protein [Bacteroidota bacterium]|nr:methyltransferase domain-containing protein [Bacteroidota bacterium]
MAVRKKQKIGDYLLGVNETELERLRFQHGVWKENTDSFLDRLKIKRGWKCLDVGAGPGFVTMELRERVGASGEVTALEPSEFYTDWLANQARRHRWKNIKGIRGTAETAPIPPKYYNLIFIRWVIAFVPSPERFLIPLFESLKPGGIIALMDYWYEGLSLYPQGGAFDGAAETVRKYYRSGGGDPYVTGKIPGILRNHNFDVIDFTPTQMAGGPNSAIIEWAHRFFIPHLPLMAQKGNCTNDEAEAMAEDWISHRTNPNTIFFSPIVVHIAGRKRR